MVDLSWPPSCLNPNRAKSLHWGTNAKNKKAYKDLIQWECVGHKPELPETGDIFLQITFHPPDKRKRDDDNYIAAFKAGRDGLAAVWGVDDNRFNIVYKRGDVVKYGKVVVEVL